jgi:hypothetical protein
MKVFNLTGAIVIDTLFLTDLCLVDVRFSRALFEIFVERKFTIKY